MSFEKDYRDSTSQRNSEIDQIHATLICAFSAGLSLGDVLNAMCGLPEINTASEFHAAIDAQIRMEVCAK